MEEAIELCKFLYKVLSPLGIYPALTGGTLYKEGERKDIDIVLFKNRQSAPDFKVSDLEQVLKFIEVRIIKDYGFCTKATWRGLDIDFLYPETETDTGYMQSES